MAAANVADCLTPAVCCAGQSVTGISIAAALGQLQLCVPLVAAVAHAVGPGEQLFVAGPAAEPLGTPRLGAAAELRDPASQLMACTKFMSDRHAFLCVAIAVDCRHGHQTTSTDLAAASATLCNPLMRVPLQ